MKPKFFNPCKLLGLVYLLRAKRAQDTLRKVRLYRMAIKGFELANEADSTEWRPVVEICEVSSVLSELDDPKHKDYWWQRSMETQVDVLKIAEEDPDRLGNAALTLMNLSRRGDPEFQKKQLQFSRELMEQVDEADIWNKYNYACLLSMQGEIDSSLEQLAKCIEAKPKHLKMASKDDDFLNASKDPRFHELIAPEVWSV